MHHIATRLSSGPYQGGGYYSQKEYRWFPKGFFFFYVGPAIVFRFLTITEHVNYSSRKLPSTQDISGTQKMVGITLGKIVVGF